MGFKKIGKDYCFELGVCYIFGYEGKCKENGNRGLVFKIEI